MNEPRRRLTNHALHGKEEDYERDRALVLSQISEDLTHISVFLLLKNFLFSFDFIK